MKIRFNKLICILTSVCLLSPVSVQAAQGTKRVPNDAIDISSTELSYDLRDQKGYTIWAQNDTVEYNGDPIEINAYPLMNSAVFPRESYSLSIEGSNVTKTLIKDGYTEEKYIYNDHSYGFQDKYDNGTILACSLLPIYQTSKRLGFERGHVEPFMIVFLGITDDYTLEELRNYNSMTDFVNTTGYLKSDDLWEGVSPGYVTDLENTALDEAKQWGYNDIDSYTSYLCEREEYAKCEAVKETWYPVYFKVSKNLVSHELAESVAEQHNYTLLEKGDLYYIKGTYTRSYVDYIDYNTRMEAPKIAKELNVDRDQVAFSYQAETRVVYHTYYSFTDAQLMDAIAAEMDIWSGRWDYFLYGDEHFNYWYESEDVRRPGYYFGNYGYGFGAIQDQMTVNYEPEYKYTITGPGRITIRITGREDQNGHGSVNLQGTGTIYLNVVSNAKIGWIQDSTGWRYFLDDGTYPVNTWKQINNNWYYFDANGYMYEQGWHWINGNCYYMYSTGIMASNTWIDGNYVNSDGVWVQDKWMHNTVGWWYQNADGTYPANQWKAISGNWYYFDSNGYMYEQGWHWIDGNCYYMYSSGAMASDTWIDGSYVNSSGVWVQGKWLHDTTGWWYQNADGTYSTNQWQSINGKWYYFNRNGYMQTGWLQLGNTWYYLNADGSMVTGWKQIGNTWYYFYSGGGMASNTWIGNSYVNESGVWTKSR